jgi:Xaa-Pro aminopeptidase
MGFTAAEMKERHRTIQQILTANNLQALLLIGDMNVGHSFYGDFRYYTNNRISFQRQVTVVLPDSEPVLFTYSQFSRQAALQRSAMRDCRVSSDYIVDTIALLREHGVSQGRVGVNFEMLPATWYIYLRKEMAQVELVEVHEDIMQVRFKRSQEEADIFRKGAALGDAGFEAALKVIRPGVAEYEIAAEIEYAARKEGAEEHFTLIGSGKFTFAKSNSLPLPVAPSQRRIEAGDSIVMEITPRYEGYWTQLVRIVNVGQRNHELEKMQVVCRDAIKKGLEQFRPGKRVMDVTAAMESLFAGSGFVVKPPFGHICAIDLVEERVTTQNERAFQPGLAAILHPMAHTIDGKNVIFWGETYMATPEGYERLHRTGDDLLTL